MKKVNRLKKMLIILPIIILLGGVIFLITPKGPILKALSSGNLVEVSPIDEKNNQDKLIETTKNSALIKIVAKETGLYKIKQDSGYSIILIDEKNEQLPVSVFDKSYYITTFFDKDNRQSTENKVSNDLNTESSEINEKAPKFAQITSSGDLDSYYLNLEKGNTLLLRIERNHSEAIKVELQSKDNEKESQILVNFIVAKEKKESFKIKEHSSAQVFEETQPSLTDENSGFSEESVNQSSLSKESNITGKEDPKQVAERNEGSTQRKKEDESSDEPPIGSSKSYEKVLFVETKETNKTGNELEKGEYTEKDSLKKPFFQKSTANQIENKTKTEQDSPIIIRKANLSVKTGTAKFDNDDTAGHDSGEGNDIVRSFDQIGYLVSFSIQNVKKDVEYTDIRYRVLARMPNAVEATDKVLRNNGEIANGQYIDNSDGEEGSQYSEGVMESVISDTGQIFVPVILNVYGATNSTKIKPQFTLEIVSAKNKKTGVIETFNKEYDINQFLKHKVPETTVSAKPCVGIRLSQGEVKDSSVFGLNNANIYAYDVGVVTVLQELPGRDKGDYKGTAFPTGPVTYQIKQKGTYSGGNLTTSQYSPFTAKAISLAENDRSLATWKTNGTVNVTKFTKPLNIPNGKTEKIYTSLPNGDKSHIGVYNSGTFSKTDGTYVTNITNSGYTGVLNPYTFNMTGVRTPSATNKAFSSMEIIYYWDKTKTEQLAQKNSWSRYDLTLYVDKVKYDGIETDNTTSLQFPNLSSPTGTYSSKPTMLVPQIGGSIKMDDGLSYENATPGTVNKAGENFGGGQLSTGQKIYFSNFSFAHTGLAKQVKGAEHLLMWDATAFEYDDSKEILQNTWSLINLISKNQYGVAITESKTPPYTMKVGTVDAMKKLYKWYSTPEDAKKAGKISAVLYSASFEKDPSKFGDSLQSTPFVPVKVIAENNVDQKTPAGNPITILGTQKYVDSSGKALAEVPVDGISSDKNSAARNGFPENKVGTYKPSVFNSSGEPIKDKEGNLPMLYWNQIGDCAYIKPFSITTKTDVIENVYQSNKDIDITLNGVMTGSDSVIYDGSLTTTLPKGISYKADSSVDGDGKKLSEPVISSNINGTTTLRWIFSELSNEERKAGIEVRFKATSDFTKLSFKENGYTNSLVVKTFGEMWVSGKTSSNDKSAEEIRSSQDSFIEVLIQQIILSKTGNKPAIELGETDPLGVDDTITYKVKMLNNSAAAIPEAKLLDVLPYDGDSRGTKLSGAYTIEEISVNEPTATISYTNSSADEKTDPNTISGWSNYVSGTTAASAIKNAKAVLVSVPSLDVGKEVELTVKVKPTNQKAGDVFVNDASMNSKLNMPVESQAVWTRVYGRELTGVVWYDDNLDGLIGNKSAGGLEEFAKDIPVKLYRTSLVDENYKDKLVEASLTGEKFVDSSGNSLIKTDKDGKYIFAAIPEGTYVAEFVIGSRVEKKEFHVTKQQVGDDPTKNSKADPNTYKTPGYKAPLLENLNSIENVDSPTYKIENVNLGLIRPATIRLFKFETGSAVDTNGDGKLSDEEKATGKPLKGATFEIYKKGETTPIATADTDTNGYLMFEYLYKGSYQLKETKSPEGYELIKELIDVEVVEGNQNVALFASDDKSTELPFTGANKWVFGLLIGAAITMVAGFGGITYYYRQPKKKGE